jgi:phosphoserine phosphatase RsbU/P
VKILLVDDDEVSALVAAEILRSLGHEVETAADGESGLQRFGEERFPVVILDWVMPGISGLDVCRRIREHDAASYTYIILLTGRTEREDRLEALEAGADDFLTKPVDHGELRARLRVASRILGTEQALRQVNQELSEARQNEIEIGGQIQRRLLVGSLSRPIQGFDIETFNMPSAGIDGDFLDFFPHGEGTADVVAGDVMGKGLAAALVGAGVKTTLQRSLISLLATTGHLPSPASVLGQLHRLAASELITLGTFVTLCYLRLEADGGKLSYVNCGHPRMVWWSAASEEVELLDTTAVPLGFLEDASYHERTCNLGVGDLLFLYSDGVSDLPFEGTRLGSEGVRDWLKPRAHLPLPQILSDLSELRESAPDGTFFDDFTCVALRYTGASTPDRLDCWLETEKFGKAREVVRAGAERAGMSPQAVGELVLGVQELLSNATRHGRPGHPALPVQLDVRQQSRGLVVTLRYPGKAFDPTAGALAQRSELSEGGFGLDIIRRCANAVRYERDGSWNVLTLECFFL